LVSAYKPNQKRKRDDKPNHRSYAVTVE
jgi:hypothetical protein